MARSVAKLAEAALLIVFAGTISLWIKSFPAADGFWVSCVCHDGGCDRSVAFYSDHGELLFDASMSWLRGRDGRILSHAYLQHGIMFSMPARPRSWERISSDYAPSMKFARGGFLVHHETTALPRLDHNDSMSSSALIACPHAAAVGILALIFAWVVRCEVRRLSVQRRDGSLSRSIARAIGRAAVWNCKSFVAGVSFFLLLLILGVWIRSYWATPAIERTDVWEENGGPLAMNSTHALMADRGILRFILFTESMSPVGTQPTITKIFPTASYDLSEDPLISRYLLKTASQFSFLFRFKTEAADFGPLPAKGFAGVTGYQRTGFINVPCWAMALALGTVLFFWLNYARRRWRNVQRGKSGLCSACGYDLRASDGRCPECGAAFGRGAETVIHA